MKHLFNLISFLFFCFFIGPSCNNNPSKNQSQVDSFSITSPQPATEFSKNQKLIDSAKSLIIEANSYVAKGITGEMKNARVNKYVNPLMKKFFAIYKQLSPADTLMLQQFRIDKINELVDLKLKSDNK